MKGFKIIDQMYIRIYTVCMSILLCLAFHGSKTAYCTGHTQFYIVHAIVVD